MSLIKKLYTAAQLLREFYYFMFKSSVAASSSSGPTQKRSIGEKDKSSDCKSSIQAQGDIV